MSKVSLSSNLLNAVTDSSQLVKEIRTVLADLEVEFREDGDNVSIKIPLNANGLHKLSLISIIRNSVTK